MSNAIFVQWSSSGVRCLLFCSHNLLINAEYVIVRTEQVSTDRLGSIINLKRCTYSFTIARNRNDSPEVVNHGLPGALLCSDTINSFSSSTSPAVGRMTTETKK